MHPKLWKHFSFEVCENFLLSAIFPHPPFERRLGLRSVYEPGIRQVLLLRNTRTDERDRELGLAEWILVHLRLNHSSLRHEHRNHHHWHLLTLLAQILALAKVLFIVSGLDSISFPLVHLLLHNHQILAAQQTEFNFPFFSQKLVYLRVKFYFKLANIF